MLNKERGHYSKQLLVFCLFTLVLYFCTVLNKVSTINIKIKKKKGEGKVGRRIEVQMFKENQVYIIP